jgi:benzoylformate decarboxylase
MGIRTVRDISRELLREWGMTTVFGNPGTTEIGFLTDWPNDFRYVLGLQESVVVGMADGYAQAGRRPVLVNLHSAGGLGHALGQVFTAYRNRTPMVVLAGQQSRSLLPWDPFLGAADATLFPRPYVKWSCEPARAGDVPAALSRAYHLATQAPRGPVFLSVPSDDWDAAGLPVPVRPPIPGSAPDPDALRELVAALAASGRPAIVAGPAVDAEGAVPELVALAERTNAGVWASPLSARCSFPENHRLFLGFLQPERKAIASALAGHDLVLVLGAPAFTYHVDRGEAGRPLPPLFLVSDDEQELARASAGTGIRAGAALAIRRLAELVRASGRAAPGPMSRPPVPPERTPVSAEWVYSTLAATMPDNAIVVEEAPSHRTALHDQLPITSTDTGFLTVASGALGYGLPAAVGAALARPDRTVVAVLGDGSSMYGIQALWTAARENVPLVVLILDNARYAAVSILGQAAGGEKLPGVDLGGLDFVGLAESMGCAGYLVERPAELRPALSAAWSRGLPTVLHVRVDPAPNRLY